MEGSSQAYLLFLPGLVARSSVIGLGTKIKINSKMNCSKRGEDHDIPDLLRSTADQLAHILQKIMDFFVYLVLWPWDSIFSGLMS